MGKKLDDAVGAQTEFASGQTPDPNSLGAPAVS